MYVTTPLTHPTAVDRGWEDFLHLLRAWCGSQVGAGSVVPTIRLELDPLVHLSAMLPLADILHRSVVLGLAGITGWGLYTGASVHFQILEAGQSASTNHFSAAEALSGYSTFITRFLGALAEREAQEVHF